MAVATTTAASTKDVKVLMAILRKLANGEATGWTAKRSDKGQWTVGTSRRNLRLSPPDSQWDDEKAREHLGKLRSAGLPYDIDEGRERPARNGIRNAHLTEDYSQPAPVEVVDDEPVIATPSMPAVTKKVAKARPLRPVPQPAAPSTAVRMPDPALISDWPQVHPEDGEVTYTMDITPDMARELLERPFEAIQSDGTVMNQRPKDAENVKHFRELIAAGKFVVTHQGIAIGINGSLYDGQHRCHASVEMGRTIRTRVTFNVHPDKIEAFDGGKGRTTATKMTMKGYKHANTLGTAAKLFRNYTEWEEAIGLGEEGKALVKPWKRWYGQTPAFFNVDHIVAEHPGLYEAVQWAAKNVKRGKGLTASVVAVFRYLALSAWPEGEEQLDKYLNAVVLGLGIDTIDHVARAIHGYVEKIQDTRKKEHYAAEEQLYVLIKCWDLYVKGKTISLLKPGTFREDDFPLVYKPKARKKP